MGTRNRLKVGILVSSSNKLKHIESKRFEVRVIYSDRGFFNKIIKKETLGFRTDLIKY